MFRKFLSLALVLVLSPAALQAAPTSQTLGVTATDDATFKGAKLLSVFPGSAAEQMHLQPGDVIFMINGNPVNSAADLPGAVQNATQHVVISFVRNGLALGVEGDLTPGVVAAFTGAGGKQKAGSLQAKNVHKVKPQGKPKKRR